MYNKILVPLDGSILAESVIPFVNQIIQGAGESRKIEITLLNVFPTKKENVSTDIISAVEWEPAPVSYTAKEMQQNMKSVMDYLKKVDVALKKGPMVSIKTIVKINDDPADEILKTSNELKIDLIAIATHTHPGLEHWEYGRVVDTILHNGKTPVFMVRAS
jgi:nucleotide-binding universal stress UspA family protein